MQRAQSAFSAGSTVITLENKDKIRQSPHNDALLGKYKMIGEAEVRKWISSSSTMLDIAICTSDELPTNIKNIGPEEIDQDIKKAFPDQLGAFPTQKSQRLLQRVAARVTRRIALRQSEKLEVSSEGLLHSWFSPVFSELTSLVPIRHLARAYARDPKNQIIAVKLETQSFTALNGWGDNSVEPLYLACELRRRNVPVFLYLGDELSDPKLTFNLSPNWTRRNYPRFYRDSKFRSVMCKNTIRRPEVFSVPENIKKCERPGFLQRLVASKLRRSKCRFEIHLDAGPEVDGIRTFSVPNNATSLDRAFVDLMSPLTTQVAHFYKSKLAGKPVETAHVADNATLEGGLLAAEVVKQGGNVHLWPHSANVVHLEAHDPKSVSQITVAVRSTGAYWEKAFGPDKVIINRNSILPEHAPMGRFEEEQPLNIILFAGAHFLRRVPLLNYAGHEATWTTTLDTLLSADVDFLVKHKSKWETRHWISQRTPNPEKLRFSNKHANKLQLPNMVFVCVSLTSTAILEGIARGIPGFVVRDVPVDETPHYDPDSVPFIRSEQLGTFLGSLKSKASWNELREKQRTWFECETRS